MTELKKSGVFNGIWESGFDAERGAGIPSLGDSSVCEFEARKSHRLLIVSCWHLIMFSSEFILAFKESISICA